HARGAGHAADRNSDLLCSRPIADVFNLSQYAAYGHARRVIDNGSFFRGKIDRDFFNAFQPGDTRFDLLDTARAAHATDREIDPSEVSISGRCIGPARNILRTVGGFPVEKSLRILLKSITASLSAKIKLFVPIPVGCSGLLFFNRHVAYGICSGHKPFILPLSAALPKIRCLNFTFLLKLSPSLTYGAACPALPA